MWENHLPRLHARVSAQGPARRTGLICSLWLISQQGCAHPGPGWSGYGHQIRDFVRPGCQVPHSAITTFGPQTLHTRYVMLAIIYLYLPVFTHIYLYLPRIYLFQVKCRKHVQFPTKFDIFYSDY